MNAWNSGALFLYLKKEMIKFKSLANIVAEHTMKITGAARSLSKEKR